MTEIKRLEAAARARIWYHNNKEKAKNNYKRWSGKNKEHLQKKIKCWRENNKEHLREYHRNWMRANKFQARSFPIDLLQWLQTFFVDTEILNGYPCLFDSSGTLAILYCSLHNSTDVPPHNKDRNFHNNLRKLALSRNIRLITVFGDEWTSRNSQVKNFLKSVLGREGINVAARKCNLQEISVSEARNFMERYHIQGEHWGTIYHIGAFYEGELVGVMTLSRHHRDASQTILDRLCFKDGVNVQGGSSRLFKRCLEYCKANQIPRLISWSDNRWSTGRVYEALGFILGEEVRPDYSYVRASEPSYRLSKQSQKKSCTKCPEGMTEQEWSLQNGLHRIFDCGKKKWIKEIV